MQPGSVGVHGRGRNICGWWWKQTISMPRAEENEEGGLTQKMRWLAPNTGTVEKAVRSVHYWLPGLYGECRKQSTDWILHKATGNRKTYHYRRRAFKPSENIPGIRAPAIPRQKGDKQNAAAVRSARTFDGGKTLHSSSSESNGGDKTTVKISTAVRMSIVYWQISSTLDKAIIEQC